MTPLLVVGEPHAAVLGDKRPPARLIPCGDRGQLDIWCVLNGPGMHRGDVKIVLP
ncbi:MAG: hypothetical protein NT169_24655 [Chloroflexi bacterium]|nr:hypothetical protein [Chloroflexota bacterium]